MPGCSDGKRLTPPASVTPVIVPDTSTGLVSVTDTPGTAPPCASVTRTRIEPVCTCAETGSAATVNRARAESQSCTRFIADLRRFRSLQNKLFAVGLYTEAMRLVTALLCATAMAMPALDAQTRKTTPRKSAEAPITRIDAEWKCASELGVGVATGRRFCDVLTGNDPKE